MDIFEHFACYTRLPILLDDVSHQAAQYGSADEFLFASVDVSVETMQGMHLMYEDHTNGAMTKIVLVVYSSEIGDEATRRMVCCKEILHSLDDDDISATSEAAVNALIDSIVVPPSVGISNPTWSDHTGMLKALMVLLPRDALVKIRERFDDGDISVEEVAQIAIVPDAYARLALSPMWAEVAEMIA